MHQVPGLNACVNHSITTHCDWPTEKPLVARQRETGNIHIDLKSPQTIHAQSQPFRALLKCKTEPAIEPSPNHSDTDAGDTKAW